MHYICVILTLVWWSDSFKYDKYAKQKLKKFLLQKMLFIKASLKLFIEIWPVVYVVYIYTHYLYYFGPQLQVLLCTHSASMSAHFRVLTIIKALIAWLAVIKSTGGRQSGRAKNRHAPVFSALSMNRHREVWRSPSADWTEIGVVPAISPFSCNVRSF